MATITASASISTISYSGNSAKSGTMSWTKPTVPSGATISSCKLTGTCVVSASSRQVTVKVNGTTVANKASSGNYNFEIDLGTSNNTTSVTVTATGSAKQASGTVSFNNLVYTVTYEEPVQVKTYTVTFKDWNGTTLKTQTVEEGSSATAPSNPAREGYNFTGWDKSFNNITANITITAQYSIKTYTVIFKDDDGSTLKTQTVNHGSSATAPSNPSKDGYTFTGWDKDFSNVTSDLTVTAQYTKNEEPEPEIPEGAIPVEKTIALRPISATQDSGYNNTWTNIANTYDTDTSTNGTIIVTGSSQTGFKRKYVNTLFNFETPIPANATINSAILTIRAKQSATTNLNIAVSIGDHEVIGSTLLSSSTKDYTADVANYIKDLNQLNINLTSAATSNRTFTLYDVRVDVNYTAYEMPKPTYTVTFKDWDGTTLKTQTVEEGTSATAPSNPSRAGYNFTGWDVSFNNVTSNLIVTAQYEKIEEPDLIEPVDGYIAKNLVSHGDWSYTFNVDWDTQYLDIEVLNYEYGLFGTNYYYKISNNSYDAYYSHEAADSFIIHDIEVESDQSDIDIIRYSKVDGVCIITSNGTQIIPGNSFANDNKTTVKADIITEWLKEEDGFMTFNIKITDIASSEEPEREVIEWTGVGTVATGLRAYGENHDNYKINLDWENECFDIVIVEGINYNPMIMNPSVSIGDIVIGENKYYITDDEGYYSLSLNNNTIYVSEEQASSYPTIRFNKDGIYLIFESEALLIAESIYETGQPIYVYEDNESDYNNEYDLKFNLVVSELPNEEPEKIKVAEYKFDNTLYDLMPEFNEGFIYTYEDIIDGEVTTRTIKSAEFPTAISFENSAQLLEVYYLETSNMTSAYNLFYNCSNLIYVNLNHSDFSNIETIERMFTSCTNLVTIDGLNDLNISKVHNMDGIFSDCRKLKEINVSDWYVSKVTNFGAAFRRCYEITSLDINNWDTSSAVLMSGMFTGCNKLTSMDVSNWKMNNVTTVNQMFYGCSKLTSVNLYNHLNNGVDTLYLFGNCSSLNNVEVYNSDYNTVNMIISTLPTRTTDSMGALDITGVDDISQIDIATAESKFWNIVDVELEDKNIIILGSNIIENMYIGNDRIIQIYLNGQPLM